MFNKNKRTMNNIKNQFSIKDLENISGIKAHTIRIWEKRYNILEPMRTDSNIRYYDTENLQKLLNITLLHNYGYKISRIAKIQETEIPKIVNQIITEKSKKNHAINDFKLSMMNFDQQLFLQTYQNLLSNKSFKEVFFEIFILLLEEIGYLWQSNTITPAHEHFISYLIKQKLLVETEKLQIVNALPDTKVYILFLPENEIHELGLMFINYELLSKGYRTIYLGESIPVENLKEMKKYYDEIVFISHFTIQPQRDQLDSYVEEIRTNILDTNTSFWIFGRLAAHINLENDTNYIKIFESLKDLTENV
ncbi:B12 binding protein [Flavobacterium branchiophilum]|uniref:B12 binding protein n=2 Tax=Flavobacterium branchiophilum TaxID=55197 RepID=A0A543G044_9FLAO|nr:B12 binding protein [Flavobacterium branchiophilum]